MDPIKFGIISDIHIGEDARSKDLRPPDYSSTDEEGYLLRFQEFVASSNIAVDYLLVPGDITCAGRRVEMELASDVIQNLANSLQISLDRVFIVPGNHDTYWATEAEQPDADLRFRQRYDRIRHYSGNVLSVMQRGEGDMLGEPCCSVWCGDNVLILSVNTAFHDDRQALNHPGMVKQETIEHLSGILSAHPYTSEIVRIALVHHHPLQYSGPTRDDAPDFSIMQNAEGFLDLLANHRFDFLVHGHKHAPSFKVRRDGSQHPLNILACGSFSVTLPTFWNGVVNNQFHTVEVVNREESTGFCRGQVRSWTYLSSHGWVRSEEPHGIIHLNPFGSTAIPAQFEAIVREVVEAKLNSGEYIRWSGVAEAQNLQFMPRALVYATLRRLEAELHFEVMERPADFVLLFPENPA